MTQPRSAFRNRTEDLLVGGLLALVRHIPDPAALGLMRGVARVASWALPGRRETAYRCLERSLGIAPRTPRSRAIVRGAFELLALNAVEAELVQCRLRRDPEALEGMLEVEGEEHLLAALESGRGVMLCTGHLGAWELFPIIMARKYTPIWVMARKLVNPLLDARVRASRKADMRGTVPKVGGGRQVVRILHAGEPLGMVLDQNASAHGVILDFLGRPASHHKVAGVMARRFGALAVPIYVIREPGVLRFRLIFEAALRADPRLPEEEAEVEVTRQLSRSLERRVREHPEQYLWLHDRWRKWRRGRRVAASPPAPAEQSPVGAAQGTNGG